MGECLITRRGGGGYIKPNYTLQGRAGGSIIAGDTVAGDTRGSIVKASSSQKSAICYQLPGDTTYFYFDNSDYKYVKISENKFLRIYTYYWANSIKCVLVTYDPITMLPNISQEVSLGNPLTYNLRSVDASYLGNDKVIVHVSGQSSSNADYRYMAWIVNCSSSIPQVIRSKEVTTFVLNNFSSGTGTSVRLGAAAIADGNNPSTRYALGELFQIQGAIRRVILIDLESENLYYPVSGYKGSTLLGTSTLLTRYGINNSVLMSITYQGRIDIYNLTVDISTKEVTKTNMWANSDSSYYYGGIIEFDRNYFYFVQPTSSYNVGIMSFSSPTSIIRFIPFYNLPTFSGNGFGGSVFYSISKENDDLLKLVGYDIGGNLICRQYLNIQTDSGTGSFLSWHIINSNVILANNPKGSYSTLLMLIKDTTLGIAKNSASSGELVQISAL